VVKNLQDHEALANAMMNVDRWPQGGGQRKRIDTHISTVILAGDQAFKFKKPVDLGFLDFVSMESRRHACEEELRLNRRLAPQIYQAVVPITGSIDAPRMDGEGPAIDWAVQMRRFDPDALLSNPQIELNTSLVRKLAGSIADFHQSTSTDCDAYGMPEDAHAAMQANFEELTQQQQDSEQLRRLANWTESRYTRLSALMAHRWRVGRVRECHGDLHLGNIALINGEPLIFDAIEFNPHLRWVDTISDIAFLTMDLHHRGRGDLAYTLLDRYLQDTGDYEGLDLLRLFETYRALVRAKVAAIRLSQPQLANDQRQAVQQEIDSYIALADKLAKQQTPGIVITHGVSGSGKSHVSQALPEQLPGIRIRSDVERKRLLALDASESASELDGYSRTMTEQTYARLYALAETICRNGLIAIVDATFLNRDYRDRFRKLAERVSAPFAIIDCQAPLDVLQRRIEKRQEETVDASDADSQVMLQQRHSRQPLAPQEKQDALVYSPDKPLVFEELLTKLGLDRQ